MSDARGQLSFDVRSRSGPGLRWGEERAGPRALRRRPARLDLFAALLWIGMAAAPPARAATPYEAQIGGFMYASLQTIITGEFAGHTPSNADVDWTRRICRPSDYDDLRAAANDRAAFDAFHKRCHLIEFVVDASPVHAVAYLPYGYCEALRRIWDTMMAEQVYAIPPGIGLWIIFEYKGSRYEATRRPLARGAQLRLSCQDDGLLRVSGPRAKRGH